MGNFRGEKKNSIKVDQEREKSLGGRKREKCACSVLLLKLPVCCPAKACV